MKINGILAGVASLIAVTAGAQTNSFLTNGLVAYYPFNGNANDASGNGYNATNHGAVLATNHLGQANCGYYFNNAYIESPKIPLNFAGPYTFSLWFNLQQYDDYCVVGELVDPQFDCNGAPTIFEDNSDVLYDPCGDINEIFYSSANSLVGTWHQLVATVDSLQNTLIYKDGVLVTATSRGWPTNSAAILFLGRAGNSGAPGGQYSHETIDSVRLYNRALSTNEVAMLYALESTLSPKLTQDLTNSYAVYGQNATLSVSASSSSPLTYQWYFVPANDAGQAGAYAETVSEFVVGAVVTNGGYGYGNIPSVNFVGGGGSGAAGYATVTNGAVTAITMTNAGNGYTSVPTIVIGQPDGILVGQTNSSLTISNANQNSLGSYDVVVSNGNGSVTSSVVSLTLLYPPSVTNNPVGFTGDFGASQALSVGAAGTAPLSYQWLLNGTNITGATASTYVITDLTLTNTGAYTVVVTNAYGSASSSPAYVYMSPSLTSPFTGAVGYWGQNTTLDVGASGSGLLSYQWYFNGVAIPGATTNSYTLDGIQFTNAGLYSVVVSSAYGSVSNIAYQVVVNPANVSLSLNPDLLIQGTVGYSYTIQYSTDLSNTNGWMTLTNLILSQPTQYWDDTGAQWNQGQRYYRVLPGQ